MADVGYRDHGLGLLNPDNYAPRQSYIEYLGCQEEPAGRCVSCGENVFKTVGFLQVHVGEPICECCIDEFWVEG